MKRKMLFINLILNMSMVFVACQKEKIEYHPPLAPLHQVLDVATNQPISNVEVTIYKCNGTTYSYLWTGGHGCNGNIVAGDTVFTDANGNYNYAVSNEYGKKKFKKEGYFAEGFSDNSYDNNTRIQYMGRRARLKFRIVKQSPSSSTDRFYFYVNTSTSYGHGGFFIDHVNIIGYDGPSPHVKEYEDNVLGDAANVIAINYFSECDQFIQHDTIVSVYCPADTTTTYTFTY